MSIAIKIISQGAITDDISKRGDRLFGQTAGHLECFQEEVEDIRDALQEAQAKHRKEAQMSAAPTPYEMVREHDKLYHQCYSWLRDTKHINVDCEAARLHAQSAERAANDTINKLLKARLPHGSAHKKVSAPIDVMTDARARLRTVVHEEHIIGNKNTIGILVSKLKEETQARWYIYLTRLSARREEDVFRAWLKVKGRAAANWCFQRLLAAWNNALTQTLAPGHAVTHGIGLERLSSNSVTLRKTEQGSGNTFKQRAKQKESRAAYYR